LRFKQIYAIYHNVLKPRITIILLSIITLLAVEASAQKLYPENLPHFDKRRFHFGFSLGVNSTDFTIRRKANMFQYDSLMVLESSKQAGFNLAIISDLHLGPYFNLRFVPALSFAQRNLEYTFNRGDTTSYMIVKPVESTFVEFPLHLKYRSARLNNFAAYIFGGGNFLIDLASQRDVKNAISTDIVVKLNKYDYRYELGFGFDFFLEYFKFSPELKMSFGIPDILKRDGTVYSEPIDKLRSRVFLISINFEG
jgi:hypothetical protein